MVSSKNSKTRIDRIQSFRTPLLKGLTQNTFFFFGSFGLLLRQTQFIKRLLDKMNSLISLIKKTIEETDIEEIWHSETR